MRSRLYILSISLALTHLTFSITINPSTYTPIAQIPALQIIHLPSPSSPSSSSASLSNPGNPQNPNDAPPALSVSEIWLQIFCPPSTPPSSPETWHALSDLDHARDSLKIGDEEPCLALKGSTCTGLQTQVYFRVNVSETSERERSYWKVEEDAFWEGGEGRARIAALPGYEGLLREVGGRRGVWVAEGVEVRVLRGVLRGDADGKGKGKEGPWWRRGEVEDLKFWLWVRGDSILWGKDVWDKVKEWWEEMSLNEPWELFLAVGMHWLVTQGVGLLGRRWTRRSWRPERKVPGTKTK